MEVNLFQLFNEIQKEFLKHCYKSVEKYNIKMSDMVCLLFLHNNHPLDTARDIVHHQKLSPAMVSKSIDELKSYGYIETIRDENDSRYVHLIITEKAQDLIRDLDKASDIFVEILTRDISDEKIKLMTEVALKMESNLSLKNR